jgi:hypothetical protein
VQQEFPFDDESMDCFCHDWEWLARDL